MSQKRKSRNLLSCVKRYGYVSKQYVYVYMRICVYKVVCRYVGSVFRGPEDEQFVHLL